MCRRQIKFYALCICVFINFTCERKLDQIPDTGRKIVINGLTTTDSVLNVHVGRSAYINGGFTSTGENDVDSANVKVYLNNNQIDSLYRNPWYVQDNWRLFNTANYRSKSVIPQSGLMYKVVVKLPAMPDASASVIIPDLVKILKVDTISLLMSNGNIGIKCTIEFDDPAITTNFYMVDVREMINEDYFVGLDNNLGFNCDDPIVEENLYTGEKTEGIAFSDKLINGQKHHLPIIIDRRSIGNQTYATQQMVCFRLYSINKEYFNYIHDLNLYNKKLGNPLASPVIVNSNVTDGYGMFSGAAVSSYQITFQKF
jgi:hypothetical protein